jgi:hypothetical protein
MLGAKKQMEQDTIVALLKDIPEIGLRRGQVGVIKVDLQNGCAEAEFNKEDGHAGCVLPYEDFLPLYYSDIKVIPDAEDMSAED